MNLNHLLKWSVSRCTVTQKHNIKKHLIVINFITLRANHLALVHLAQVFFRYKLLSTGQVAFFFVNTFPLDSDLLVDSVFQPSNNWDPN